MDSPDKLTTLGTQDTGRKQAKQKHNTEETGTIIISSKIACSLAMVLLTNCSFGVNQE
jgi:hypothetical protein